ncbi:MAG TPA: 4-hydroxy-tetrahydrodipicolinate synthase [Flavobacteriaceae bacterium]|nr:4-hydroxy-tetrahydrodipicolinate synthase [Flavobacteriaceae bacterium]
MKTNSLRGMGVALITPFKNDFSVDTQALTRLVQHNIDNGTDYLVVLGTTGESVTLNAEEKKIVIDTVKNAALGKLPLVLGVGGNNTQSVVEDLENTDLSDFHAVLSVSPYYNKPTQEGIYQHYKALAEVSSKPIILYNVPGRTSSNIAPETVLRLAIDFENIIGVKEAAGDMDQVLRLLRIVPEDFLVISGDDNLALPLIVAGGAGVISVIGQGVTKPFADMVHLAQKDEVKKAFQLHYKLMPIIDYIFEEGNPAGIKYVLSQKGISENVVRLPLVKVSDGLARKIETALKQIEN